MNVSRSRLALLLLALGAAACSAETEPETTAYAVRDSVGVRVIESHTPLWDTGQQRWTVDPNPVLDLSTAGTGPEHQLSSVRNATRLPDGRIAVANAGTSEVRIYGENGRWLQTLGGEGYQPGEYSRLIGVHAYRGDSIAVFDLGAYRITVLDRAGALGRTAQITGFGDYPGEIYPIEDGRFLLRTNTLSAREGASGRIRVPAPLIVLTPEGKGGDTVTVAAGFETWVFEQGDARPPYPAESVQAVRGDRLVVGDASGMEYRVYDLDGTLASIARIPVYDLTISARDRDTLRMVMMEREMQAFLVPVQEAMAAAIPKQRPAYSAVRLGPDGDVWLASYVQPTLPAPGPREWIVFGAEGEWLGTVTLPPGFELYEVGDDYLLGKKEDELGVETVQMLRLVRG